MEQNIKKRSTIKAAITRIYNYCVDPNATEGEIRVRVDKLEQHFQKFEELQLEIESDPDANPETEEEVRIQFEGRYYAIKEMYQSRVNEQAVGGNSNHQLTVAIENIARNQTTLSDLMSRMSENTSTPVGNEHQGVHMETTKLPRIQLPDFDGTITNWIRFRDLFEATIHNKQNVSNIEKFEYLQSHLKGDALNVVKHLSPSSDNYEVAWQLIKKKYEDYDQIKKCYLKLLFDQPVVKNPTVFEFRRLTNNINESVNALKALKEPVEHWGLLLLFHLERKLDAESHTLWYRMANNNPTFTKFEEFLSQRLREIENQLVIKPVMQQSLIKPKFQSNIHATTVTMCPFCNQQHFLYNCNQFKSSNVYDRRKFIQNNGLCFNCLDNGHKAQDCARSSCKVCSQKHNTLLHIGNKSANGPQNINSQGKGDNGSKNITPRGNLNSNNNVSQQIKPHEHINNRQVDINAVCTNYNETVTFLPTAVVMIKGINQSLVTCRIMLDTGAQVSLISEDCVQRLNLKRTYDNTILCGIGTGNQNYSRGKVQLVIKSRISNHTITTTALCLSKLTQLQPAYNITSDKLKYFSNLRLADQHFNISGPIDAILGADTFSEWFLNHQVVHPSGSPTALETIFGWTIIGKVPSQQVSHITIAHTSIDFSEQLQKFWEIEELKDQSIQLTDEEKYAEEHYVQNVQQMKDGRYMVRLPFRTNTKEFGNTLGQATKRLHHMETRFKHNQQLKIEYVKFMNEFVQLDHMELASQTQQSHYYLPHHAVLKPNHTTTKLRVVFDGSAKGSTGISLNDQLVIGPPILNDLFTVLLQFRKNKIALCGDIEKMYRQILMHPDDRPFQSIVWRENSNEQIATYHLKTVTYGTAAAPFLAIRTLKQIAIDNKVNNPKIADIIQKCFYVDDLMCGAEDETTAIEIKDQLCEILSKGGFRLRKWSSNSKTVLNTIEEADKEKCSETIISDTPTVKTLGIYWDTNLDVFKYSLSVPDVDNQVTKRIILSIVSKVFDPLGWLSPIIITMKIFMQKLWLNGIDWDTPISSTLLQQWNEFYNTINDIRKFKIQRWLSYSSTTSVELHGFADSSELAYAAAVYLKVIQEDGMIYVELVAAKTRVAPVKQVTLPRLELCAAQLVTKLLLKVKASLNFPDVKMYGWTDSTIVLSWLSEHPRKWKNFIANRTAYIINVLPAKNWNHITSNKNPADCATRGLTPFELLNKELWWNGPPILKTNDYKQIYVKNIEPTDLEKRSNAIYHIDIAKDVDVFKRYSNFTTLIRITAYIYRFIKNCQSKRFKKQTGNLCTREIKCSHDTLIKLAQNQSYASEIKLLSNGNHISSKHILSPLSPFIDDNGLLRVGGRLVNANISYEQRHPVILHKLNPLTELIVRYYHLKFLHAGTRQMQYLIGLKYWIPSITNLIKTCVYKCTTCIRYRHKTLDQQMGNLPDHRVNITTAFHNTGIDFAGPILIRSWKGRGSKQYKAWISIFVCMATKAIHTELVTELSTDAFVAALRRFVSRRGKPENIYSDNGTNFVGCNQKLKELIYFMKSSSTKEHICKETAMQGISWHFSPPSGSHFGGLWEAGVKSIKFHLNRILGNTTVTYEEMSTILCQIESCLNSRPLSIKFEGDDDPLTPGHFLIMKGMQAVPDHDVSEINMNRLSRWQYLQRLVQSFWKKWSMDYLNQMQKRTKWKVANENLKVNDIVIIKNEQLPPTKWMIGRVTCTHPGHDGLVRVVTVKTQNGVYKRPISKLCPLLIDH